MKKFKNEFGVVSESKPLLNAFKEEAEKLGWIYDEEFTPWNRLPDNNCLYFADHNDTGACLKPNHFSLSGKDKNTYYLPKQYEEALKAASEVVEEIPEYVECINISHNNIAWTKNKIYKLEKIQEDYPKKITLISDDNIKRNVICWEEKYVKQNNNCFKPSTKEAFDAQNKPVFKVGDWVVWSGNNPAIGKIFKHCPSFYDSWTLDVLNCEGSYSSCSETHLRLATSEEIAEVIKSKLIVGEYYVNKHRNDPWTIFIIGSIAGKNINTYAYLNTEVNAFFKSFNTTLEKDTRLATLEERQWLDACVKAGKYLTKDEALKPKLVSDKTILTLGTSNIKVTVYKDGTVEAERHDGTIDEVKLLIRRMKPIGCVAGWEISFPSIKIGCSTFTLDELKQIVTAHDKLNPSEW